MAREHWMKCEGTVAATAETITIPNWWSHLEIRHTGAQALYIVFDWETGDTEVSATNFDVFLGGSSDRPFIASYSTRVGPIFANARVISAANDLVSIIGW